MLMQFIVVYIPYKNIKWSMSIDEGDRKIMKKYSLNIIQSSQVMYSLQSNQKEEILKLKKKSITNVAIAKWWIWVVYHVWSVC